MSLRLSWLSLALAVCVFMSACGPGYNQYGNEQSGTARLFLNLEFNGQNTCGAEGVQTLAISFSDPTINSITIACEPGPAEIELAPLPVESLGVTVAAEGGTGAVLFIGTQQFALQPGFNQGTMNLLAPGADAGVDAGHPADAGSPDAGSPDAGAAGSLTAFVQFNGVQSCSTAGVATLQIMSPTGAFATVSGSCTGSLPQIRATGLPLGQLEFEVNGLSGSTVLYTTTSTTTITGGENAVSLNLSPVTGAPANLTADFFFGGTMSSDPHPVAMDCSEAGVQSVSVSIDNGTPSVVPCVDAALNADGAVISTTAGAHAFSWNAYASTDGTGRALYSTSEASVTIRPGSDNLLEVDMAGLVNGGFQVAWQFPSGGTCASVGAATVTYNVVDAQGNELAAMPATAACSAGSFKIPTSPGLTPGIYVLVSMQALDASDNVVEEISSQQLYAPAGSVAMFTEALSPP